MDSDLMLVGGMFLALLALPSLISAFSVDRSLKGAVAFGAMGSVLVLLAFATKPEGYRPEQIPDVVMSVIGRLTR